MFGIKIMVFKILTKVRQYDKPYLNYDFKKSNESGYLLFVSSVYVTYYEGGS